MKLPYFPSQILSLENQELAAESLGLKHISHDFLEWQKDHLLTRVHYRTGKSIYDLNPAEAGQNQPTLFYKHPGESLSHIELHKEFSLWERILPYPWGFLKGLSRNSPELDVAMPLSFQNEVREFFTLLDEMEWLLSDSEISAFSIEGFGCAVPLVLRFVRKKCVGILVDSEPFEWLNQKTQVTADTLKDLWGTHSTYLKLSLPESTSQEMTFRELTRLIKNTLSEPNKLVRYRVPTLEDGEFEIMDAER